MIKKHKNKKKVVAYKDLEKKVAIIWTRVSSAGQERTNCSLDTQEKVCREYAERNGIAVKRVFGGTHESAKTPGELFEEMYRYALRDKEVNVILVYMFDRFSRAGEECIEIKKMLKQHSIYVVSATQEVEKNTATGEFTEKLLDIFGQFENDLRKDKCVGGMISCLERGEWYSRPPRGYDSYKRGKEHILTINEDGELLRQAFLWKANEGISNSEILERLHARGMKITKQQLSNTFHNPFYKGLIEHCLLGKKCVQGKHPALVSEEIFDKVNSMNKEGHEHYKEETPYPLNTFIKCSDCGNHLTGYSVTKNKGKRNEKVYHYYKCSKDCKMNLKAETMHSMFYELLEGYNVPEEFIPIMTKLMKKIITEYEDRKAQDTSLLLKRKTELENKRKSIRLKFAYDEIDKDTFNEALADIEGKLASVEHALFVAQESASNFANKVDM